uniref:Uncharacterized protein n=1 Tax=Timema genevievae TaxID=629358 RepID=A0A7R9PL61_TIMGE|nr:unnamed protein product [Timema genevievae]
MRVSEGVREFEQFFLQAGNGTLLGATDLDPHIARFNNDLLITGSVVNSGCNDSVVLCYVQVVMAVLYCVMCCNGSVVLCRDIGVHAQLYRGFCMLLYVRTSATIFLLS